MIERLEPIESLEKTAGGAKRVRVCPTCGNVVTRFSNKYTCGFCEQNLKWPNFDYSEKDAEIEAAQARRAKFAAERKERKLRERNQKHG